MKTQSFLAVAVATLCLSTHLHADLGGDLKKPAFGEAGSMDGNNYKKIVDGVKGALKCNNIRLGFHPSKTKVSEYPDLFKKVRDYAEANGPARYINPLGTGDFGKNDTSYANWINDNVASFNASVWGPFNEPGMSADRLKKIADLCTSSGTRVGSDPKHTEDGLTLAGKVAGKFNTFASHNAGLPADLQSTSQRWKDIKEKAGKTTWNSETPKPWSILNDDRKEIGVKAAKSGGVDRIVLYLAHPDCVKSDGTRTTKGKTIADNF